MSVVHEESVKWVFLAFRFMSGFLYSSVSHVSLFNNWCSFWFQGEAKLSLGISLAALPQLTKTEFYKILQYRWTSLSAVFLSANLLIHIWNIKGQIYRQYVSFYQRIQYSRSKMAGRIVPRITRHTCIDKGRLERHLRITSMGEMYQILKSFHSFNSSDLFGIH